MTTTSSGLFGQPARQREKELLTNSHETCGVDQAVTDEIGGGLPGGAKRDRMRLCACSGVALTASPTASRA